MHKIPDVVIRVGILSGDPTLPMLLSTALGREFTLLSSTAPARALALLQEHRAEVILLDLETAVNLSGGMLFEEARKTGIPIVVMAGDENRAEALRLIELGAYSMVRRPPVIGDLRIALRTAAESRQTREELTRTREQLTAVTGFDQMTGCSAKMLAVYEVVRRLANLDASVLITGESGTGKELVARATHNAGSRAGRPFVAISCGAIPETLIEAELFGHEKGAFTGTVGAREGYFEKAGDGTLFLDEIGELSPSTQVKLLRVLQQREFTRLGSNRPIPLRARVVFATHRDLHQLVKEGKFRQDLFYRIHVMNIQVPALRDRTDDIPLLARHLLQRYSEQYGKRCIGFDADAMTLLQAYSWPGNVRELENVIQRALIMSEGITIAISDLPSAIQELELKQMEDDLPAGSFERLLRDYKLKLVQEAISQFNGNKTLAAQNLCISRAYLHRLIRPAVSGEGLIPPIFKTDYTFSSTQ